MLSVGIDVGAQNIKAVLIDGDRILARAHAGATWDTRKMLDQVYLQVLKEGGVTGGMLKSLGATGIGRTNVPFATAQLNEDRCLARGAIHLIPASRTVIDVGAEQCQALNCSPEGKVLSYARNDNCAAGAGAFIEEMACLLEISLSEIDSLAGLSRQSLKINSTCTIFAESEVISLINEGARREDVALAILDAISSRVAALARGVQIEREVAFIGGVAQIATMASLLSQKLSTKVQVPDRPELTGALGAALIARDRQIAEMGGVSP